MSRPVEDQCADVAIVGAGPVGLLLALLLADYGAKVCVFDKNPSTGDEPRAVSIVDESLRTLDRIGLYEALAKDMLLDTRTRYFGAKAQLLAEVEPAKSPHGYPGKGNFDQPVLERGLAEAAESNELIDIKWNTEVVHVAADSETVRFSAEGPEGSLDYESPFLVGCDGGRSLVRKSQAIELAGSTQVEKWIVLDMLNDPHREAVTEFHANGTRPTVVVPGTDGRCRYEFMLLDGETEEEVTQPEFIAKLLLPYRTYQESDVRRARVYVAQQRIAERLRRGRVFLAGDAAHLMPPFAGQGLNAGFRDAANLAWKLDSRIREISTDKLLDTYSQERLPHVTEMVKLSTLLGRAIMAADPKFTRLRDLTIRGSRMIKPVNAWLTGMKFIRPPRVTDGCVVPPTPRRDSVSQRYIGRSFPQPIVSTADGDDLRLDKVLGRRWALLAFGAPATNPLSNPGVQDIVLRLDPALVRVNQNQETLIGDRGFQEVICDDPALEPFHYDGEVSRLVLIRPDRYVAAVFTTDKGSEISSALSEWFPLTRLKVK